MTDHVVTDTKIIVECGTDARKWAENLVRINSNELPKNLYWEHLFTAWFANAIEAGRIAGMKTALQQDEDPPKHEYDPKFPGKTMNCKICGKGKFAKIHDYKGEQE
jgi:hypothetical protein